MQISQKNYIKWSVKRQSWSANCKWWTANWNPGYYTYTLYIVYYYYIIYYIYFCDHLQILINYSAIFSLLLKILRIFPFMFIAFFIIFLNNILFCKHLFWLWFCFSYPPAPNPFCKKNMKPFLHIIFPLRSVPGTN